VAESAAPADAPDVLHAAQGQRGQPRKYERHARGRAGGYHAAPAALRFRLEGTLEL
jgi:hypothetical protein